MFKKILSILALLLILTLLLSTEITSYYFSEADRWRMLLPTLLSIVFVQSMYIYNIYSWNTIVKKILSAMILLLSLLFVLEYLAPIYPDSMHLDIGIRGELTGGEFR